jgi:predicted signal transduction protein with EAL and GGDEF domain
MKHAVSGLAVSRSALPITLSIGLTFATPCETAISMLARADMALYNAKRAGRNCIRILLESIDQDSSDNTDTCAASSSRQGRGLADGSEPNAYS